jgi:hypothetical protein
VELDKYSASRPYLYHLTHRDNLPHIREIGRLFPASILLQESGNHNLMRTPRRGPKPVTFRGKEIKLRDQDKLHRGPSGLQRGFSFADLVAAVNGRVFFWAGTITGPVPSGVRHFERYEGERPVILRVEFKSLITLNPNIGPLFCRYNSGSPRCSNGRKSPRGPETFLSAAVFTGTPCAVVEVTFDGEVSLPPDTECGPRPGGPWKRLF